MLQIHLVSRKIRKFAGFLRGINETGMTESYLGVSFMFDVTKRGDETRQLWLEWHLLRLISVNPNSRGYFIVRARRGPSRQDQPRLHRCSERNQAAPRVPKGRGALRRTSENTRALCRCR